MLTHGVARLSSVSHLECRKLPSDGPNKCQASPELL
jgi:hypothetical protein